MLVCFDNHIKPASYVNQYAKKEKEKNPLKGIHRTKRFYHLALIGQDRMCSLSANLIKLAETEKHFLGLMITDLAAKIRSICSISGGMT